MKLKEYIKDELFKIILIIVYIILICGFLCAFNFGVQMAALMAVLAAIFFIIMFIWDFCRKRNFYNSLIDNTQRIDKKYLVIETLDEPEFYEGNLVYTAMYDINKSMIEHINQYERGQQDFKDFIEMWVHEIKLPIASLTLMCHNDKEHIDKKFITQLNRLDDYADKVLYYVRSENAEKDYSFGKVNLKTIINKAAVKNKDIILSNNISLNVHDIDTYVNTDVKWLEFIVNQIISNSIKYKKTSGEAYIEVYSKQRQDSGTDKVGYAVLHIKDNGIGMSQEFVQKIFSPFERERTSTVSRTQGTGLGMAITKNIVDMMGGTIEVQTEQDKGTEFIVRLPFRTRPEHHHTEKIAELEGFKALVVDDDFNTCDSVTKMLVKVGMRSEWTVSGKEAVLRARQSMELGDAFYAYIIDWRLPDMNGIEVTRQIRSLDDNTPIIILTAYDWSDIEVEARAAGVTAFCAKPLFMSDIRETLMAAIGQKQARAEDKILPEADLDFRGRRILLVEDNELNSEIAVEILKEYGFLVDTAENGAEAVEKIKNSTPEDYDLVLMDVQMPVMNGYEATKQIRALDDPALSGITVLAMTANAFDEDRKKVLECGMDGFLSKPIIIEELIDTLQKNLLD